MTAAFGTPGSVGYVDPFKGSVAPKPPAPVTNTVPSSTYTGPINDSINNTQQGADLVNANQAQAAGMGVKIPGSTFTPPTQTTTSQTTTETPTSTTETPQLSAQSERDALAQAEADYQAQATQVHDTITNIQNGSVPLSAGEQAQIDGLKAQFKTLIDAQTLTNTNASGIANIRGYQTGAAEYDPSFQVKTIGSIVSAGQAKIADFNIKMASAVSELTQAFHDNDINAVKDAWSVYQDASKVRRDALQKTIDDTQKAIKAAQDAHQQQLENEQVAAKFQYDTVTKPIQDIASSAAANGATASTIAKISSATSMQEAINAAGDSLLTATGDAGAYLFSKRQAEQNGVVAPDYDTWYKALQKQQFDSEIAKIQATEGIKFNYSLALEKAKKSLSSAPTPNYHGEFAATIKLAAQAGGTNAQRSQIKSDLESFIADGDYKSAYAQIISSAGAKLTGANASNFQQQLQSNDAITSMAEALQSLKRTGYDTNLLKGGADAIQTKIGVLATDPRYAAVATQVNMAFQQYRQNMTGAAFGAKESAEYASVMPSSGNTFSLNMAKIQGAQAYLNSQVESVLKNTVGEGGIYVKQYAQASQNAEQKQQVMQDKMAEFRGASDQNEQMVQEMHSQFPDWTIDQIAEALNL